MCFPCDHHAAVSDNLTVSLYRRGGYALQPRNIIDPVIMVASSVMRLQPVVSREVDPSGVAMVTVGSMQAGQAENIIADHAELTLKMRTMDSKTRAQVIAAVKRIVTAECDAGGVSLVQTSSFSVTVNNRQSPKRCRRLLRTTLAPTVIPISCTSTAVGISPPWRP